MEVEFTPRYLISHLAGGIIKTLRNKKIPEKTALALAFKIAWKMARKYGFLDQNNQLTDRGVAILKKKEEKLKNMPQ